MSENVINSEEANEAKAKKSKKMMAAIIVAAVAVIAVIIISVIVLSSDKGYEKVIDDYIEAINENDTKAFASVFMTDEIKDVIVESGCMSESEINGYYGQVLGFPRSNAERVVGSDCKLKCEINDVKDLNEKDAKGMKEDWYSVILDEVKSFEGYEVDATITMKGSDDDYSYDVEFVIVEINDEWMIDRIESKDASFFMPNFANSPIFKYMSLSQ